MKIRFDQGTPVPLRQFLTGHRIDTTYEKSWSGLSNGALLAVAEQEDYNLLITTDQNLRYQQNLTSRKIAIVVLRSTSWPRIKLQVNTIKSVVDSVFPGAYHEISIS